MFLIYQNIIKFISSIFSFLIFTISFFLLQLSISFINITPIEFLIKPFLVNKIDGYDNSFSEAILSKKTNKMIPFFNLGPKNDWRKFLDKNLQLKISSTFEQEINELKYINK